MEKQKEINYNLEDLARYRPFIAAAKFYKEENETAADSVLEKSVSSLEVQGRDGYQMLDAIQNMKEGNKFLTNTFAPKYSEILMNAKVSDLVRFYSGFFKKHIKGDSYEVAMNVFREYGDENYIDILDKYTHAQEIIESKRPKITKEEKEKAQATFNKYHRIVFPLESFEQLEMKKLIEPVNEDTLDKTLNEMFKPNKKSE